MEELKQEDRGLPQRIKIDNGPEFISKDLDKWAYVWISQDPEKQLTMQ